MSMIVGLTGGIASGKTTVANLFHQHFAIDLVDADIVARQVVEPESAGLNAILEHFGSDIVTNDGELNRPKLREIIFHDEQQKQWINQLLHPMIRQEMQRQLAEVTSPYGLLVVPLLVENQLQSMADRILVIDVSEPIQIERTMMRDQVSEKQARAILASQATREQRLAIADDVIKNDDKNQELLPQIAELHQKYLALSRENR
ncbi:dephospho-CoA kinase [Vibrio tritonius]|uniref:dephospho-CoA kinase n=1 Tax=Vibrio tritonius TaxID=1435069 RepID=UPI00315DDC24